MANQNTKSACFQAAVERLKGRGVNFAPGLATQEFAEIESVYDLSFPPDLKVFL